MSEPKQKIKSAVVGPMPRPMPVGMFDPEPKVTVTYEDNSTEALFSFYPDEIRFSADEFTGLTRDEALALRQKKDKQYLQS